MKVLALFLLLFLAGPLKAQTGVPIFEFGEVFGLSFDYPTFSPDVVSCSATRTTNCVKEFRGYDVKDGTLLGTLTPPPDLNTPAVGLVIVVAGYKQMGLNGFVVRAVDATITESVNSNTAPAKFLPPPAANVKAVKKAVN